MTQHYFSPDPDSTSRPTTIDLVLPDLHLRLTTDRGTFSPDKIDLGTRILLETVPTPPPNGHLLDLGCGYGPIALTMAARAPHATILGVDVNPRALALATTNAHNNHLHNATFALTNPDGTPTPHTTTPLTGPFDAIWSNPPIRIGKNVLHPLLHTWLNRLTPGGTAHLVVQKHLGADSLHRWLDTQGHPTERIASRAGYRILRTTRPA
ncbi:class I SAM-dependent methyltransferase [Marinactinospora thermotolerans]|uniref:16S rRNA m(2)G 1207 methyltransferase n=1 Tax=Marinactinospora thermotolerans DSM 45154 TaxID=1122192 RepID=A0A1T4TE67_9ACTN|nr:methyltransferase [Marinactinospora thermotolerans]SKA38754.1 16S rRNA m(2)G 1207 methyltransferase [Marinactinospora thermotolerans DSM 45154]